MTTDPVARMRDCIKQIKDSNNTDDDDAVVAALEELVEWTEQIDFAIGKVARTLIEVTQ